MKRAFGLLFCMSLSALCYGQVTRIGDRLTIKVPSAPEIQQVGNKTFYLINDSTYVLSIMLADMRDDPSFNIAADQLIQFYRGVIEGTLKAGADSKLLSETPIKVGEYEGREIRYTKDFNGVDDIPITKRILLVDKSLYTFDIWDFSKKGQENFEKHIFESITVE